MSNEPLAVSEIWADPSDEADYDAIYAALLATERGRWFLGEYVGRNRPPDAPALGDALPQPDTVRRRDLAELAAAINRVKAEFVATDAPESSGVAAAERIQDIAFALRERDVDAALCDALDAAIREISVACALNDAATERACKSADLLRDLAGRITDMIALWIAADRAVTPAAETSAVQQAAVEPEPVIAAQSLADGMIDRNAPPRLAFFATEAVASEGFAQTVAVLAAALPTLADRPEPESEPQSDPAGAILPSADHETVPEPPPEGPLADSIDDSVANVVVATQSLGSELAAASIETSQFDPLPVEPPSIDDVASDGETEPPAGAGREGVAVELTEYSPAADNPGNTAEAVLRGDDVAQIANEAVSGTAEADVACEVHLARSQAVQPEIEGLADAGVVGELPPEVIPSEHISSEDISSEETSREALPPEHLPSDEQTIAELPRECAVEEASNGQMILYEGVTSEETLAEPRSSEVMETEPALDEASLRDEQPNGSTVSTQEPGSIMPPAPTDDTLPPELGRETDVDVVSAASEDTLLAADVLSEAAHAALTEAPDPVPQVETETAIVTAPVDAVSVPTDTAQSDLEPANPMLPDLEALVGPDDDPGDLFEPLPLASPLLLQPVEVAPVEDVVVEQSSVDEVPVEAALVENEPVDDAPVEEAPSAAWAVPSITAPEQEPNVETTAESAPATAAIGLTESPIPPPFVASHEQEETAKVQTVISATESDSIDEDVFAAEGATVALSPPAAAETKPVIAAPAPALASAPTPAPAPQPRVMTGSAARPTPRPAPNDPLMALRALSEEEIIALFS